MLQLCSTTSALQNLSRGHNSFYDCWSVSYIFINDYNKCITSSLGEWRSLHNEDHKFLVHQLPPCSLSRLLDEIRTNSSNALYSVCCAFMTIWCLGGWAPCVQLGCVRCVNMSRFSRVSFGHLFCIFPFSFISFVFFLIQFSVLGFVSPPSFLSLFCISW